VHEDLDMPMVSKVSGAMSRNKGANAERALVGYLRRVGFGGAERAVRTGYRTVTRTSADPGDVTGTPGIIWSCKDVAATRANTPSVFATWFAELDAMDGQPGDVRLLVHKRAGYTDPGLWWCWMRLYVLANLMGRPEHGWPVGVDPVRMELGHVIPLLHAAGYGDPIKVKTTA
jgi:hypothetical protein